MEIHRIWSNGFCYENGVSIKLRLVFLMHWSHQIKYFLKI